MRRYLITATRNAARVERTVVGAHAAAVLEMELSQDGWTVDDWMLLPDEEPIPLPEVVLARRKEKP